MYGRPRGSLTGLGETCFTVWATPARRLYVLKNKQVATVYANYLQDKLRDQAVAFVCIIAVTYSFIALLLFSQLVFEIISSLSLLMPQINKIK